MSLVMQSDPSLSKCNKVLTVKVHNFRLVYERKCPVTLVLRDMELIAKVGQEVQEEEELIVKLLVRGPDDNPDMVRIEMLS